MRNQKYMVYAVFVLFFALLFATTAHSADGQLSVIITDSPWDEAQHVVLTFTGVVLMHSDGSKRKFPFNNARSIDVLENGQGAQYESLLNGVTVPAGQYDSMRFLVKAEKGNVNDGDSYIVFDDGTRASLYVPGGSTTGIKVNTAFDVYGTMSYSVSFDLEKLITMSKKYPDYKLNPTSKSIQLVENEETASISGTVDALLAGASHCPSVDVGDGPISGQNDVVYIFQGLGVTPDDDDGVDDAVAHVGIASDGGYSANPLNPGDYTLAFTCMATFDKLGVDDVTRVGPRIKFTPGQSVTLSAGEAKIVNF